MLQLLFIYSPKIRQYLIGMWITNGSAMYYYMFRPLTVAVVSVGIDLSRLFDLSVVFMCVSLYILILLYMIIPAVRYTTDSEVLYIS